MAGSCSVSQYHLREFRKRRTRSDQSFIEAGDTTQYICWLGWRMCAFEVFLYFMMFLMCTEKSQPKCTAWRIFTHTMQPCHPDQEQNMARKSEIKYSLFVTICPAKHPSDFLHHRLLLPIFKVIKWNILQYILFNSLILC